MIRALFILWLVWQTVSPEAQQHLQAATEAEKQKQFDRAISEFQKVTELEPRSPDGFVRLGQAYMEKHDYGAAIQPLKHALELAPDLAAAHQLLGATGCHQSAGSAGQAPKRSGLALLSGPRKWFAIEAVNRHIARHLS